VQLVVNKLLHVPTTALREAEPDEGALRAAVLCELFGLQPSDIDEPAPEEVAESPQEKARA